MLCVVRMRDGKITGWAIAADKMSLCGRLYSVDDAEKALARKIEAMDISQPGKFDLGDGCWLLVEAEVFHPRLTESKESNDKAQPYTALVVKLSD